MTKTQALTRMVTGAAFAGAVFCAHAQAPSPVPQNAVSDVGSFEAVPYTAPTIRVLRAEDKAALRNLEDRQLQELRALEDRYETDLRALRAKQYAERQELLKSFERR